MRSLVDAELHVEEAMEVAASATNDSQSEQRRRDLAEEARKGAAWAKVLADNLDDDPASADEEKPSSI